MAKRYSKSAVTAAKLQQALRLYENFSGHDGDIVVKLDSADVPGVLTDKERHALILIGAVDFIGYTTVRDSKTEAYVHRFRKAARPSLAVSHDGRSLYIVGGRFRFTNRGIVDAS